jgi:hypothetical protein
MIEVNVGLLNQFFTLLYCEGIVKKRQQLAVVFIFVYCFVLCFNNFFIAFIRL